MIWFWLSLLFHIMTSLGYDWHGYAFPIQGLLFIGTFTAFTPATIAEVVRSRVLIFTIWPRHFISSLPGPARLGTLIVGLYFVVNLWGYLQAIVNTDLTVARPELMFERYVSGFLLFFCFISAMYFRYALPKTGQQASSGGVHLKP